MPLPRPPGSRRPDDAAERRHQENVQDFKARAVLYGLAAAAGAVFWIAVPDQIPIQVALPLVGGAALEAGRNFKRWLEWRDAQPKPERLHPDRVRALEQETVRVMSDAVRARAWFTRGIVALVAIPSVLEVFVGLDRAVAVAAVDPAPIRVGEWWRLLGGTYLHGSYYHFAGNMGALLLYGSILESKTSPLRLPLVYLLACLAGSLASVAVPPDVPSIGASGGVVGVIGYLFVFSRRQALKFPAAFRGATLSVFVGLIAAGALGFWYIDNPGHAGGALAGVFSAGLIVDTARNFDRDLDMPLLDLLGWLAVGMLVAGSAMTALALVGPSA